MATKVDDSALDQVQLDALVVIKIIKHTKENLPELVTGQLLGLDFDSTLEVTNCFPFPRGNEEEEEQEAGARYQLEMMKCLREVNVDNNTVGWYQSTYLDSIMDERMIETQYKYQLTLNTKCVVVVYDPLKTSQGSLSLSAYRLTPAFMELYKTQSFTKESMGSFSFTDIFERIAISIHNSAMVDAYLCELENTTVFDSNWSHLDLATNPFIERNLEFLIECVDDLGAEQSKLQYHQRQQQKQQAQLTAWLQKRKQENLERKQRGEEELPLEDPNDPIFKPVAAPSRLDSLLSTNRINNYCHQLTHFSGQSLTKLYLAEGLQKLSS